MTPPDNLRVVLQGATGYLEEIRRLFRDEGLTSWTGAIPGAG